MQDEQTTPTGAEETTTTPEAGTTPTPPEFGKDEEAPGNDAEQEAESTTHSDNAADALVHGEQPNQAVEETLPPVEDEGAE